MTKYLKLTAIVIVGALLLFLITLADLGETATLLLSIVIGYLGGTLIFCVVIYD